MKSVIIGIIFIGLVFLYLTTNGKVKDEKLSCKQKADILFDLTECENRMKEIAIKNGEDAVKDWSIDTIEGIACNQLFQNWKNCADECEEEK